MACAGFLLLMAASASAAEGFAFAEQEEFASDVVHWTFDNGVETFVNCTAQEVADLKPFSLRILKDGKEIYSK